MHDLVKMKAEEFARRLKVCRGKVFIFIHRSMDGDCIGASCGLCIALRNLGFDASVLICELVPERMRFLCVEDYCIEYAEDIVIEPELAIAVDCAMGNRMGIVGNIFDNCDNKLVIDHHASVDLEGDGYWIEPNASSASELAFYMCSELALLFGRTVESIVTKKAAQFFLTGMITDTGRFSYSNTNPQTLEAASILMKLGADTESVMYWFFDWTPKEEYSLVSEVGTQARFDADGRIATAVVTLEMLGRHNAKDEHVGSIVSSLRDVDGVVVAFVLRETNDNKIRVNIRSREPFNAMNFASLYGGGGHIRASGFTVDKEDIYELREQIIAKAMDFIE